MAFILASQNCVGPDQRSSVHVKTCFIQFDIRCTCPAHKPGTRVVVFGGSWSDSKRLHDLLDHKPTLVITRDKNCLRIMFRLKTQYHQLNTGFKTIYVKTILGKSLVMSFLVIVIHSPLMWFCEGNPQSFGLRINHYLSKKNSVFLGKTEHH